MAAGDTNFTNIVLSGDLTVGDDLAVTGDVTLSTPLKVASANESLKRESLVMNFPGTLADGTTYKRHIPMQRAGTIKKIWICAGTKMVGGTNTLAIAKKQGGTSVTVLSTATVNPTAVPAAADTAEALTLSATAADLVFAAGDCLIATLVCGTMTTDGADYALIIEVEYTDV